MGRVFYNENDPKTAAWLGGLAKRNLIESGTIDTRSITDIQPGECHPTSHFFAGIGGWSYALRLAGWPTDRPVWTGSCPCQPFSVAGKHAGTDDPRHLWPAWLTLIRECRPATIFGEQVASRAGREWLAGVRADLEALGYAVGAADLCAAGVGAPHIRQRLFWVADDCRMGDATGIGHGGGPENGIGFSAEMSGKGCEIGRVGATDAARSQGRSLRCDEAGEGSQLDSVSSGAWNDSDLLPCADRKSRRVESGTFPLAHGVPARVGRLRGYGNAIVPQVAAVFVRAFLGG